MHLPLKALFAAAALAAVLFGYHSLFNTSGSGARTTQQQDKPPNANLATTRVDDESAESNPFGLNTAELDVSPVKVSEPEADDVEASATDYPPLNAYDIAQGPIDDESLTALIQRLRDDKQLLNDIIVEYRSETDPKRLSRLNTILGYVATPETLVLAQEMIYTDIKIHALLAWIYSNA